MFFLFLRVLRLDLTKSLTGRRYRSPTHKTKIGWRRKPRMGKADAEQSDDDLEGTAVDGMGEQKDVSDEVENGTTGCGATGHE